MTWSGRWVSDRLGVELTGDPALSALVGMALRRNPKRAHLLVSTVLGKHVPTDPRIVYGAGRLLGALVADRLTGTSSAAGALGSLVAALSGGTPMPVLPAATVPAVVLGYAETATGLGHAVADALTAPYLHSTRRDDGGPRFGSFSEEHSHASGHLLLPADPAFFDGTAPVVLVDDELSTGTTALNTVRVLAGGERRRFVLAALVDLRSAADRQRMVDVAAELGVMIDVVALATGRLELPDDVLRRGQALVAAQVDAAAVAGADGVSVQPLRWPTGVTEGGRHGFDPADRPALEAAAAGVARQLAERLTGDRVLVLGFEELMYAPLRIATELAAVTPASVRYSTTTRSPVVAVADPGYAIRSRLTFPSHDDPADGPGSRYAYNVAGGGFTDIVLVVDDVADTAGLRSPGGLLPQLQDIAERVHLVVVPAARRLPAPLHGPDFGSYAADEVAWLLTDLSAVTLEAPTEEREEAIQSGGAHYAESLPIEFQPSAEYQELFHQSLRASAAKVAVAVGVVTELVLAARGPEAVLVSLARAGTPVGVLMHRWARQLHGLRLPHYAVSIVRGRGIDTVALRYLAAHHDPASVMFVDGWTGKGAIARELAEAVEQANAQLATAFSAELAVLADTGSCVSVFGTREDYLIPSACLNSTVSGLVSRTVLNDALIGPGQYHGAKFYADLAGSDVSDVFLDAVTAKFAEVGAEVERVLAGPVDRTPTWDGWRTVERLSFEYGIGNVNLVKPGVGETTRVLLRRVPWKILMRSDAVAGLHHLVLLAKARGVEVELVDDLAYSCVGLIHPHYTRPGS